MILLFDATFSVRLVDQFSERIHATHVASEELLNFTDTALAQYASDQNLALVSTDSEFIDIAMQLKAVPKIIVLRTTDSTTRNLRRMLMDNLVTIQLFVEVEKEARVLYLT